MNIDQAGFLIGQMTALQQILKMVILASPNDEALRREMRQLLQPIRDAGIPTTTPESWFQGWDTTVERVLGA